VIRCASACVLAALTITLTAIWSLAPVDVPLPQLTALSESEVTHDSADDQQLASLDPAAFVAQLWTPPPPPVTMHVEAAVKQAPPPDLILLAISHEGNRRVAALYDKRLNRVFLAEVGDALSAVTVTDITESAVELAWSGRTSTLRLRKDES